MNQSAKGHFGNLPDLETASIPKFPGYFVMLGPGLVWMALAQGSGELIWWPYIVAKYGLGFVCFLIPACLLQLPVNYAIGRYTALTGEGIFSGFIRLNRWFAFFLWILFTISFLWIGAFTTAGGTALAELTHFPSFLSVKGQSLFWAYVSIILFFLAILLSKVIYQLIEKIMWIIAIATFIGLVVACTHSDVVAKIPEFAVSLVKPSFPLAQKFDPADSTRLLTAITFAGLGGFWTLFYSYWLREKGVGMGGRIGRITSPITGHLEKIPDVGFKPDDCLMNSKEFAKWKKYLLFDNSIGVIGNIFTTLMTCLLAYVILQPKGLLPKDYQIAVVQSEFFFKSFGLIGKLAFLFVGAVFLSDTWLTTVDAVSRIHVECLSSFFPKVKRISARTWYYIMIVILTIITSITMVFSAPGPLILMTAVIGFIGTVIFVTALFILNLTWIKNNISIIFKPSALSVSTLCVSMITYYALAGGYLYCLFFLE